MLSHALTNPLACTRAEVHRHGEESSVRIGWLRIFTTTTPQPHTHTHTTTHSLHEQQSTHIHPSHKEQSRPTPPLTAMSDSVGTKLPHPFYYYYCYPRPHPNPPPSSRSSRSLPGHKAVTNSSRLTDRVFAHALQTVRKIPKTGSARPPADDRLRLYGLYKQSMG